MEAQNCQLRDQREAERRTAEAQVQREHERRDAERKEDERREEHQFWLEEQIEAEKRSPEIPPQVAQRFADEIEVEVEDALEGFGPDSPRSRVTLAVKRAVAKVIDPWMREQQRKTDIARAVSCATNCLYIPGILGNLELENEAKSAAFEAIVALPERAIPEQMVIAGRVAAQKVVRDHQQQKDNERSQRQHEEEVERSQRQRKADVEVYLLLNVRPYFEELQNATDGGYDFHGQIHEGAQKIAAGIKQRLLADNSLNAYNARQRVRDAVDHWLDANVRDEDAAAE